VGAEAAAGAGADPFGVAHEAAQIPQQNPNAVRTPLAAAGFRERPAGLKAC
jgi:hypothetical protein